jgi:hypothetical protein
VVDGSVVVAHTPPPCPTPPLPWPLLSQGAREDAAAITGIATKSATTKAANPPRRKRTSAIAVVIGSRLM